MNLALKHFKNEPSENYQEYFINYLCDKGVDVVDELLDNAVIRNGSPELTSDHVMNRHVNMSEEDMVHLSLKTGQSQGVFSYDYKTGNMNLEEFKELIYSGLFECAEAISQSFADSQDAFKDIVFYDFEENVGFGINKNFDMVKSNRLALAITSSSDPLSNLGIEITTAYPEITKGETIKNRDALMKEYSISDREMKQFERRRDLRDNIKEEKQSIRDIKNNEYLMSDIFSNR